MPGGQIGQWPVLAGCEYRWRGAVLDLDQGEACDGLEVPGPDHVHGDGGGAAPGRGWLDAVGAVSPESEVRQRFGQAGQRGVEKVVAPHTGRDQRCREVPKHDGEDPGRIGEVRVDGEAVGRQAGVPAGSRVLPHNRGHDRDRAPVLGRDQAVMAAAGQALQRGRADPGTLEPGCFPFLRTDQRGLVCQDLVYQRMSRRRVTRTGSAKQARA